LAASGQNSVSIWVATFTLGVMLPDLAKLEPRESEDPRAWRDQLSLRLARAFALMYLVGTLVMFATTHGRTQRLLLTVTAAACAVIVGIPAVTGRPKGRLRAWCLVIPAAFASLAGYALAGFLSGPAVVFTMAVMLSGLLLGRAVMLAFAACLSLGIAVIAWAMIHSYLAVPNAADVSMTHAAPWARTIFLSVLAIGLIGGLFVEVIARMERSLEQATNETHLREQAERDKANAEIVALEAKQLETIGRLAAGVAHDFNNNLTTVIGCAELLKEELGINRAARELVEDVLTASQRAAELTRQLLAFSRKAQMVLVPTNVHELIENAVALLRRSVHPRVQVATRLNAETATVMADATLLDNAILNLLVNAGDAMPNGGQLTVATTTYQVLESDSGPGLGLAAGTYMLIEVLDTGMGIDSEVLPNIFDPFFTTKPVGKGTGLGLAAVSGTIKAHRGSINVESEPGCGSAFRILLPCATTESASTTPDSTILIRGTGEVLLVDDDPLVRRTAATTLRNLGYTVTTANDGVAAIELFDAAPERFAVVLLDLRMPRLSGEATFNELYRRGSRVPVVIWSGFGDEQDARAMLRQGAAGFIQKPYRIADLSRVLYQATEARSARTSQDKSA